MTQGSEEPKPDPDGPLPETGEMAVAAGSVGASPPKQTIVGGVGAMVPPDAVALNAPAHAVPSMKGTALMHAGAAAAASGAQAPGAAPKPASPAPTLPNGSGPNGLEGRVIKGRYLVKRLLGEGGMGGVYEGEHLEIGRRVAIKVVSSHHARDPHIAARIKQEARSTSAIESEHIVQVFDAGEDDEVGLFLVMELLKGEDLSAVLARQAQKGQKGLPPLTAISFMAQASQGLARAHAARIVHRDLKPANIFVCTRDDGTSLVKLVDFGIAKLLRDASAEQGGGLTRMGMVIGTPQYMSPEQAQGLPSVDHRTDIYSLGAVLFEVVAGQSPYAEMPTYEQTILQIMMKQAPRLSSVVPDVLPSVDQLCADMMAHDPAARPQEMSQVRERLQRILAEMGGAADTSIGAVRDASAGWRGSVSGADDAASKEAAAAAAGVSRPGTHSAVAVDPPSSEDVPSIAGLPRKRSGLTAVIAIAGLLGAVGAFVVVRGARGVAVAPAANASIGLVQGAGIVAAGTAPTSPSAAPAPSAATAASAAPPPPTASTAAAPPASAAPTATVPAVAAAATAPAASPAAVPAQPTKRKPAAAKPGTHRVGATDMDEQF